MPVPRYAFLDGPTPAAFAHRGGAKERPENTVASFTHALELGFTYLETDVHVTSDGIVAAIHDPFLDRVTDRHGSVADLPWAEVAVARIDGTQAVPRLDELLAAWPDARWNIDAKHDAVVEPLVAVLQRAGALDRVCVTSFSDARIGRVRALAGPRLCTSTGPRGIAALRLASVVPAGSSALDRWSPAGATQVPARWGLLPLVDRRYVSFVHRQGMAVHVWTVDDEAEMDRLLDAGVDGIMTDRPTLLRRVLRRRSAWTDREDWTDSEDRTDRP